MPVATQVAPHEAETAIASFQSLNLPQTLMAALDKAGYTTPSPIQHQAIPPLLAGRDLLGHAPTGTGKTAAFALPLLARLDLDCRRPQVLTLTPTRELAIQVAEAFRQYASGLRGFNVLPIVGGQSYTEQNRQLQRGAHVVVGTPGRVMDHIRKGRLDLSSLEAVVLDEADEMLRMGFIEEVEWILEQTPQDRQMALFSATMSKDVERISRKHLNNPHSVTIESKTATAETVRQRYWVASGMHKLDALTRILEVEPFEAVLIFVRTKTATAELAELLESRGYAASALNGDMAQAQREQTVERLRRGKLNILVATDVAARGLDVDRISHVINYDIPFDAEAYIHRIGRTGRAGRQGEAILFVAQRERRMLNVIERTTRQKMEPFDLPTTEQVNAHRIAAFKEKIGNTLAHADLKLMQEVVEQYTAEHNVPAEQIAAALAKMALGGKSLLVEAQPHRPQRSRSDSGARHQPREDRKSNGKHNGKRAPRTSQPPAEDLERFRIEVGHANGVQPGNIVGAIANEAGIDGKHIGHIAIEDDHSLVDLPIGMPREIFRSLKKVWVCGQQLKISRIGGAGAVDDREPGPMRGPSTNGALPGAGRAGTRRPRPAGARPGKKKRKAS